MAFGILFRDKNLLAENIKKGVRILKVTGTCEGGGGTINNQDITANSSTALQSFTAGEGYDGIGVFTLRPYSKENRTVDSSTSVQVITPETADCLWTVLVNPYILDSKTVDSSTVSQTVTSSQDGLGSVTVNPYTLDSKTVDSSTVQQVVNSSADGLSSVTVNPYVLDSKTVDSSIVSQTVTSDEDGLSSVTVNPYVLDSKTVDSSTVQQVITSSEDGLGSVTVNPYVLDTKTVNSSTSQQIVTSSEDGLSSVTVNPYVLDSKTVDSSTVQQVITSNEDGLSSVTVNPYVLDSKTVDASTSQITVNSSADGLSSVTVNAVTSSIDSNITAGNIKTGVSILGVTGTYGTDGNWVANAIKNMQNLNLSNRTLISDASTRDYGYAQLFTTHSDSINGYFYKYPVINFDYNRTGQRKYVFYRTFYNMAQTDSDTYYIHGDYPGEHALYETFKMYYNGNVYGNFNVVFDEFTRQNGIYCDYALSNTFYNNGNLRTLSFPVLERITAQYLSEYMCYGCKNLTSVSFPELTQLTGNRSLQYAFKDCTSLTNVSFPKLTQLTGGNGYYAAGWYTFQGCTSLTTMDFPELTTCNQGLNHFFSEATTTVSTPKLINYVNTYDSSVPFNSNTSVTTVTTHPLALKGSEYNLYYRCSGITSLTLTGMASDDLGLDNMGSLDRTSIVGVLQHLDTNTSGKTCTFYTGGLTIMDDQQHSVQGIYDLAVQAGWTINNLTIDSPDLTIIYPASGQKVDPTGSSNYIEFDAVGSWTAVTSSNDVTLDSYSGSAGSGVRITVTVPSGWEGDETVTISCNSASKTVGVRYYYIQYLDYLESTNTRTIMSIPETFNWNSGDYDTVDMDVSISSTGNNACGYSYTREYACRVFSFWNSDGRSLFDYPNDGGGTGRIQYNISTGRHNIIISFTSNGNPTITVDSQTWTNNYTQTGSYTDKCFNVFDVAPYDRNSGDEWRVRSGYRVYGIKWYRQVGGVKTLIHDYKPAMDPVNNKATLYDEVTQTYLTYTGADLNYA